MSKYLIIDSNKSYAEKLYAALTGKNAVENIIFWDFTKISDIKTLSDKVKSELNSDTIVLINAEARLEYGFLQEQSLVELVFWLRCKHKRQNVIVFYSLQSINHLLKTNPENFILLSPGCYHIRLPLNRSHIEKIASLKPLENFALIKPYLKPNINLEKVRHRYANYTGMSLMLNVAKKVWGIVGIPKGFIDAGADFSKLSRFRESLDYHLLSTYFDLETLKVDEYKNGPLKIDNPTLKILLIDDLAKDGWELILSQMIYGNPSDNKIKSLTIPVVESDLEHTIGAHKPHLILLDLRLDDEKGEMPLEDLGGYKLLKHLKTHPWFKGLPVIMFTASSNAENTKQLIELGAEAVWTKPGLDEGLTGNEIIDRYAQLIKLITDIFHPDYNLLNQINNNSDPNFDINTVDLKAIRNLLFSRLDFIEYRLQLYSEDELLALIPPDYKSVDAVYLDANSLIDGVKFDDQISSVYKLAILTANSAFRYMNYSKNKEIIQPKIVIMNAVFDEVIKIAKTGEFKRKYLNNGKFDENHLAYLRAAISQPIIKEMFIKKLVRTEFDINSKNPRHELKNPKENVYADGYILDEIAGLIITHSSKKLTYCSDTKVVFVTNDKNLTKKLETFNDNVTNNLTIKNSKNFIADMSLIKI